MLKSGALVILICVLTVSDLCRATSWPKPEGLCPEDSVINAKCSCRDDEGEKKFSCVSDVYKPSDGRKEQGNYKFLFGYL